ncbi:MAG: hypothetical protein Q8P08_02080, partial [bacterium]|nr:hypothetical protein [bacterium]
EGFYAVGGGDRKLQPGDPRLTRLSFLEKEEINLREKIQKLEYDLSNLQRKLDQANSVAEESSLSSKFWQKKAAEDQASLEIWKKRAHERLDRIIKAQNRIEELEEVLEQNQISISSRQDESQETNTVS